MERSPWDTALAKGRLGDLFLFLTTPEQSCGICLSRECLIHLHRHRSLWLLPQPSFAQTGAYFESITLSPRLVKEGPVAREDWNGEPVPQQC